MSVAACDVCVLAVRTLTPLLELLLVSSRPALRLLESLRLLELEVALRHASTTRPERGTKKELTRLPTALQVLQVPKNFTRNSLVLEERIFS